MSKISPKVAAQLADEVYDVQDETRLKLFLMRPEFSKTRTDKQTLQAEVGARLINTKDGFGVCARGGAGYEKDLFLVFRGSTTANYMADWVSNFRIGMETSKTGLPVHIGFNHIFSSMQPKIKEFLSRHTDAQRIHCIGHSLGGAVATLVADWVRAHTSKYVRLYTFGAPKPGFEMFSRNMTYRLGAENIHRVYHATDPVPMIPLYPFTHTPLPGWGYHLPSTESLLSAEAHSMGRYIASVGSSSWQTLAGPPPLSSNEREVERWLKSEKTLNPFNPKTWDWINAGLMLVLKKIMKGVAVLIQVPFIAAMTLADKIAWLLRKGIDMSTAVAEWVFRLMGKIAQALGMAVVKTVEALTQVVMKQILHRLMERIGNEAARAVRHLVS